MEDYIKRLVDFGIVEGLQELLVSDYFKSNEELQMNISAALYNISCLKDYHLSMVSKNAVSVLFRIWESSALYDVKRYCALNVCHLSCGHVNSAKIVDQSGTKMICWMSLEDNLSEEVRKRSDAK